MKIVTAQDREALGEDGFTLRVHGETLEIRGSGVRGCLYGVYELLERFGGCRWYASDFEVVPKLARLVVPEDLNITERPAFAMRQTWWYDVIQHPFFAARLRLNGFNHTDLPVPEEVGGDSFRFGGDLPSCHTFYTLMPPEKYFKEHPEYYSLINGKRETHRSQLCLTNPDVLRIVTEEVLTRIRRDPGAKFYGISQNDCWGWCECANCKAVDEAEDSHAGTVVKFVNAVAEAVEREFPDVLIETLAYQYTRRPPKTLRYRHNVVPCLCTHGGDMSHPYATGECAFNASFREDIVNWKNQGRELYVWDYATLFGALPGICPDVKSIAPNIRFFKNNNVKELFQQGCGAGVHAYLDALKVWLSAKLMWNPDADETALIHEFTDAYYGKAAALVREDIDETCRLFSSGKVPLDCEDRRPLREMPPSFFTASRTRLEKALAAVTDDEDRAYRVRTLMFSLDFTELELLRATKPDETKWTAEERERAPVLARRLLAFLSVARAPVKLSYHVDSNEDLTREWSRLASEDGKRGGLDPVVSLYINTTSLLPGDAHCISAMKRLNRDYGLRRFFFDPPGLRRPFGNVDHALHVRIGESFKAAKEAMPGCEICWFVRPVLCWSARQPGQHIMDADGNVSSGLCPLDDAANEPYYDSIRTVAKIAGITYYLIEDDLNLSGHPGLRNRHGGCFCPLHLAELEKRIGRRYMAKELGAVFDAPTKENESVRIAFADVSRDSLARFSRKVREAIDSATPDARVMLFQSAQVDIDGDTTEANARVLAGATRPSVRVYGASYFCQNVPEVLPKVTAHTFYTMQHLPDDVKMFYEADCFPHSRFYNSTLFYLSEIGAAFMAGADDLLMFTARSADDPFADTAYFDMIRANRPRFEALKAFGLRSSVVGVRAVYDAQVNRLYRERGSKMLDESARLLAKFGFPMTTKPSGATVLFGETAHRLSEAQLREIFKGAVLVDSTAALRLTERGLGGWLGCSVRYAEEDLEFARSRVLPVAGSRVNGLNPYDYHILEPVTPVPGWDMKMDYVRITPGTTSETWVRYEDVEGRTVAPSFVVSKNPQGGTTAVMSFAVKDNFREWLYSPEMQDVWRNFFDRATNGALDVTATKTPSTWLAARVSDDGRELLVMVNNLAGEPRSDIALEFSKKWRGGRVEKLAMDGTWQPVGTASDAFRVDGMDWPAMAPEFLRVTKK